MTLNGTYTWTPSNVTVAALGRRAYSRRPVLPAFLLEEPYDEEGPDGRNFNPSSIQPVRRFQWWGWLSTIGGYIRAMAMSGLLMTRIGKNHSIHKARVIWNV